MADNKKYYYLKLKDNFFDSDAMIILESMPDGYLYSNILLKLYLRSLKFEGKLMFNEFIPYNSTILAQVTRHQVGTVEKALDIFKKLGLIELLDNGAIYMLEIQNFIGKSSTEADRKREYRGEIENEKTKVGQMSLECPDKTTPEIEKELEKEKELDIKFKEIEKIWNEQPRLNKIKGITKERKKKTILRIKENSLEEFLTAIKKINDSDFATGSNKDGWIANFDWLVQNENNIVKVLEGNYDNKKNKQQHLKPIEQKGINLNGEEIILY